MKKLKPYNLKGTAIDPTGEWKLEATNDPVKLLTLYIQSIAYPEEFSEGYSKRVHDKIREVLKNDSRCDRCSNSNRY